MTSLTTIEGIGEVYSQKLKDAGITTTEALLEAGATAKGRQELEAKADIGHGLILDWVNRADLFRIKGISEEYADLLEAAGVDTVPELAQRDAENLYAKLQEVNVEKKLVRKLPGKSQVANWIDQSKALPRVVSY
jgi:predicted flap endonuclease-1-like 5' DNA nuclease